MLEHGTPILVTGGCGFVGRHLTRRLLDAGHEVHVVDNLTTGRRPETWVADEYIRETHADGHRNKSSGGTLRFYYEDIRSFLQHAPDRDYGHVFHLAAVVGGRTTIEGEPLKVATDLAIDAQFFNWAIENEPGHILYASSSAAYPTHLQNGDNPVRLREDHIEFETQIGKPDMTYGWAKLTGEYLARIAAEDYGLSVSVVRPFSGYGEGQDLDYPIPAIARRAYRREDPLTVWGSGEQVRDFVYIDDCIEAMLLSTQEISDGTAINIGTGRPTNFLTVAETFAQLVGYEPEIVTLPNKPEGPHYRCADTEWMETLLDWSPETSIHEGFSRVLERPRLSDK